MMRSLQMLNTKKEVNEYIWQNMVETGPLLGRYDVTFAYIS